MPRYAMANTAQKNFADKASSLAAHHDKLNSTLTGHVDDFSKGGAEANQHVYVGGSLVQQTFPQVFKTFSVNLVKLCESVG